MAEAVVYKELSEPILDQGIRNTHFFNGRVVTALDFQTDQIANRQQHQQLGQAIGAGVAWGLEVRLINDGSAGQTAVVSVSRGLALNRAGQAMSLPADTQVTLARQQQDTPVEAGLFQDCGLSETGVTLLDEGIYILVMSPTSGFREKVPMRGFSDPNQVDGCGSRYAVEGVKFRLERLELTLLDQLSEADRTRINELILNGDAPSLSMLRNYLAHICLGTQEVSEALQEPFLRVDGASPHTTYGALDAMHGQGRLTDFDVPLVLLYWRISGIQFRDTWSVRRPLTPAMISADWAPVIGSRRAAERLAVFLQFQEHIDDLRLSNLSQVALTLIEARQYFRYLPPCGFLPILGFGAPRGLSLATFFNQLAFNGTVDIPEARLIPVAHDALRQTSIDLDQSGALQLFRLQGEEGAFGLVEDRANYLMFTRRGVRGTLEQDALADTFQQAWTVYRGLIRRRTFLSLDAIIDATGARIIIQTAIQGVMAVAHQLATLAKSGVFGYREGLDGLNQLYDIQRELVHTFLTQIHHLPDTQQRTQFANTLLLYLETAIPGGITALRPAVLAGDILEAVQAQDAINNFVGAWTGEGVAIGSIRLRHQSSPDGLNLVPDDPPRVFRHIFELSNFTDKTLAIDLNANIAAYIESTPFVLSGDWSSSLRFRSVDGALITSLTLPSDTTRNLTVEIVVPSDAQVGERARLRVSAAAALPNNQTAEDSLILDVAASDGAAVNRIVRIANIDLPSPVLVDLNNIVLGRVFGIGFDVEYVTNEDPFIHEFTFELLQTVTPPGVTWGVAIVEAGGNATTHNVTLTAGNQARTIAVRIAAPGVSGSTLALRARIRSDQLGISDETSVITMTTA